MIQNSPFFKKLIQTLPVFIAYTFHAIALDRWLLVGPAIVGLCFAVLQKQIFDLTSRHWYLAAGSGLLLGLVFPSSSISVGPLPSSVTGSIAGISIALAILATLGNRVTIAWVSAWAILAMSGKHAFGGQLNFILMAFLFSSLVAVASNAGLLQVRARSLLTLSVFAVLTAVSTYGISLALKQIDRAMLSSVENFLTKDPTSSITGLSSNITLGKQSQIKLSPQPLLEMSEMTGVLRSKVMDHFDGQRWTTSPELKAASHSFDEILTRPESERTIEFLFLDDLNSALPSPAGTFHVVDAKPRITGGWVLQGEPVGATVTMVGAVNETLPDEPEPVANLVTVPDELREGLGPIAKELTDPSKTNQQNAEAITAFFYQNFEYSLTTDLTGDDHPLVTLVKERRPAYCVYFASAMAAMLRTQGIPARVVSGFVPSERNALNGRVTIRERDAHAWVEVWSPQQERYVAFDPTPSASRLQATGLNEPDSFLASLIQAIRSAVRRLWMIARQDPIRMMWILIESPYAWFALVTVSLWLIRKFRRPITSAIDVPMDSIDPQIRDAYERYLVSLEEAGVTPQPWESDQELIDRLAEQGHASLSRAANQFIQRYRDMRFGGDAFDVDLAGLANFQSSHLASTVTSRGD